MHVGRVLWIGMKESEGAQDDCGGSVPGMLGSWLGTAKVHGMYSEIRRAADGALILCFAYHPCTHSTSHDTSRCKRIREMQTQG